MLIFVTSVNAKIARILFHGIYNYRWLNNIKWIWYYKWFLPSKRWIFYSSEK